MTAEQLAKIAKQIDISVASYFIEERVDGKEPSYLFGYNIKIKNNSDYQIQLMRRHWVITDSNGQQSEVEGEGVVGQQPVITSGNDFEYSSGSPLATPVGTMHGDYTMLVEGDSTVKITINPFRLAVPGIIH